MLVLFFFLQRPTIAEVSAGNTINNLLSVSTNLADEHYGMAVPTTARLLNLQVGDWNGPFDSLFKSIGIYQYVELKSNLIITLIISCLSHPRLSYVSKREGCYNVTIENLTMVQFT